MNYSMSLLLWMEAKHMDFHLCICVYSERKNIMFRQFSSTNALTKCKMILKIVTVLQINTKKMSTTVTILSTT